MQYEVMYMSPKDKMDESLTVLAKPSWYDFGSQEDVRRFYGSGHCWWEIVKDAWGDNKEERASSYMSGVLHDLWIDQLNKRLEKKNVKVQ